MDKQDYKNAREFLRKIQSAMSETDYSKGLHELTETADNFHTCFECLDIAEGADRLNVRIRELGEELKLVEEESQSRGRYLDSSGTWNDYIAYKYKQGNKND